MSTENEPPIPTPPQNQYNPMMPPGDPGPQKKPVPVWAWVLGILLVVCCCGGIGLSAILFPVFAQAKIAAKKTATLSLTKRIGTSIAIYEADADDMLPPLESAEEVSTLIDKYFQGEGKEKIPTFTFNTDLSKVSATAIQEPQNTWLLHSPVIEGTTQYGVGYADTHAKIRTQEELDELKSKHLDISK